MEARQALFEAANPGLQETGYKKDQRRAADRAAYQEFTQWLSHWPKPHQRMANRIEGER